MAAVCSSSMACSRSASGLVRHRDDNSKDTGPYDQMMHRVTVRLKFCRISDEVAHCSVCQKVCGVAGGRSPRSFRDGGQFYDGFTDPFARHLARQRGKRVMLAYRVQHNINRLRNCSPCRSSSTVRLMRERRSRRLYRAGHQALFPAAAVVPTAVRASPEVILPSVSDTMPVARSFPFCSSVNMP